MLKNDAVARCFFPLKMFFFLLFFKRAHPGLQVCELLVYQKKVVVPFIRQSALTHETMGDEIMADTIRYSPLFPQFTLKQCLRLQHFF